MYLKCHKRFKDGKDHRYWSIVESVRTRRGVIKRQLLYLGEINDSQRAQWCSALDVLDESNDTVRQMSLFPADRTPPPDVCNPVRVRLNKMTLHHPRTSKQPAKPPPRSSSICCRIQPVGRFPPT